MLIKIKKIVNKVNDYLSCRINPVKYAKKIGVNVGENLKIYGGNPAMFSTEPWIISLGDNVHITADVQFVTHDGGTLIFPEFRETFVLTGRINVGDNTYIGTRTIILPGVTIGKNCIIGAGSIVTHDIPDNSVAVGVPARVVSDIGKYAEKVKEVMNGENPRYFKSNLAVNSIDPLRRYAISTEVTEEKE